MSQAPITSPAARPAGPGAFKTARQKVGRGSLLLGAGLLLALSVYQVVSYFGASFALANSGLAPFYRSSFKALWLGMALQTALVAVLVVVGALQPARLSGPALVITSLIPLAGAALLAAFLASFVGAVLLAAAALLVLTGALLR